VKAGWKPAWAPKYTGAGSARPTLPGVPRLPAIERPRVGWLERDVVRVHNVPDRALDSAHLVADHASRCVYAGELLKLPNVGWRHWGALVRGRLDHGSPGGWAAEIAAAAGPSGDSPRIGRLPRGTDTRVAHLRKSNGRAPVPLSACRAWVGSRRRAEWRGSYRWGPPGIGSAGARTPSWRRYGTWILSWRRYGMYLALARINDYEKTAHGYRFAGPVLDAGGQPIEIEGLWGIGFGNDGNAGPSSTLFFAAGPDGEAHGLFGRIDAPE
jgi:hypothetical protein